jgi:hypothetical protein
VLLIFMISGCTHFWHLYFKCRWDINKVVPDYNLIQAQHGGIDHIANPSTYLPKLKNLEQIIQHLIMRYCCILN